MVQSHKHSFWFHDFTYSYDRQRDISIKPKNNKVFLSILRS